MTDKIPLKVNGDDSEDLTLSRRFADSLERFAKFYEDEYNLSRKDAVKRSHEFDPASFAERIKNAPSDQISWFDLAHLAEHSRDAWKEQWELIKADAKAEIESGHRAADVVSTGFDFGPLSHARFLAVRDALRCEWQPLSGSESFLIDSLAQIQIGWEMWLGRHLMRAQMESYSVNEAERRTESRHGGRYWPERIEEKESLELSANMADRFNKMYIRTLRTLRDLKRMSPQVVVQNAAQINVGQQQLNVQENQVR